MKTESVRQWFRQLPVVKQVLQAKIVGDKIQQDVAGLRALLALELDEKRRENAARSGGVRSLHPFEQRVYSQNGEDGVIQEIFRRIGAPTQTFIEIGVGDGWENNTVFLLPLGWRGVWVDADPAMLATVAGWPPEVAAALKCAVACITRENAAELLTTLGVPREPDLLSIDIDHNTYHIWETLGEWRPRLVVVEYNALIPPSVDWQASCHPLKAYDDSVNFGASLKALERLGQSIGYRLVHCELAGVNAFFVRSDLAQDRFEEPATAEHHYEPPRAVLRRGAPLSRRVLLDRSSCS